MIALLSPQLRRGLTLTELMVALVVLVVLTVVVSQAARQPLRRRTEFTARIDSLRQRAVRLGKAQSAYLRDSTRYGEILALPTGEIVADSTLRLEPMTGELHP